MQRHGWTLLFHECIVEQLRKLSAAATRAVGRDPNGSEHNANVKLFRALSQLIMDVVPGNPARDEYRQGKTLGAHHRHWRRAKFGRRFRLFFRYDSVAKVIVFAWVNDEMSLRSSGSKSIRTRSSQACSGVDILPTTGRRWSRPAEWIGPRRPHQTESAARATAGPHLSRRRLVDRGVAARQHPSAVRPGSGAWVFESIGWLGRAAVFRPASTAPAAAADRTTAAPARVARPA